ncbi:MAG TPA: proprotein convertase P-domain-containing protein [Roseiflexaceae bacterium]|nr:proprotein convertase P-domain-containing protein [Roseiflexaceae bacterium]
MTNRTDASAGTTLQRGGEAIALEKVPDQFTARVRPGVRPAVLAESLGAEHAKHLERHNLELLKVDAERRDAVMQAARADEDVAFASHVYRIAGDPSSRLFLTDEITVQFKPEVGDEEIEALAARYGLQLLKEVPGVPHAFVFRVTEQATENPIKIANRLVASGRVLLAEPNVAIPAQTFHTPGDPLFAEQWHLHHTGGPFLEPASHIDAVRAWDITRGMRAVVIAVADDSCDLRHEDFRGEGKIVAPRDFAGRDFDPLPEATDDNHGTACCGVAVAEENGVGVVGVAPGCALMPIRTSGFLDDNSIEELFGWVTERGAAVVSCSWGPSARDFPLSLRQNAALHRCATVGRGGKGCVIVFAAGNANRPVDGTVDERGWPNDELRGPTRWRDGYAAHEDVIAVAAITSQARKAAYSNWGRQIALCAPSNNAHPVHAGRRTFPQITTPITGLGVVTTDRVGPAGYDGTDYTRRFGGTSSACPVVAGVAGLVISANPDLTARQVREILEATADKIEDPTPDAQLGNAFGAYDARGHSQWFGYGRVNAFKAVSRAVEIGGDTPVTALRGSSAPALAIPDNTPDGVRDTISFAEDAAVASVAVTLAIRHTYIGDLRVTLMAPSGASVVLHDRAGGGADDLRRSYDVSTTPGLRTLEGQQVRGAWTLWVQDVAPVDTGVLERWELAIVPQTTSRVEREDVAGQTIPDNTPAGIVRELELAEDGTIDAIEVDIDITHTYIGDLEVTLTAPSGRLVVLHQRAGGAADNLIATYRSVTHAGLGGLRGQPLRGTWRLHVADRAAIDVGKLNRWALRITRARPAAGPALPTAPAEALPSEAIPAEAARADDFKLIKGIGPGIERALHQAGIRTYAQLASSTPEEIAGLVGHISGMSAERIARQDWLGKARELARQAAPAQATAPAPPTEVPESRQHYATFTVELLLDESGDVRRTRVVHVQENQQDTWPGWQDGRLVRFFIERSALRKPGTDAPAFPELAGGWGEQSSELTVEAGELMLEEAAAAGEVRLRARLGFHIGGQNAGRLAEARATYFVHVLAYIFESGQTNVLASTQGRFVPQQAEYQTVLEFAPPEVGRYQILATVVMPEERSVGVSVGPVLRVEP